MAGRANAEREQLNRIEGLAPDATGGTLWKQFNAFRDVLNIEKKGRPDSRKREALAQTLAWAKERGMNINPGVEPASPANGVISSAAMRPLADFAGKKAHPREVVEWVAENVYVADPDHTSAPDSKAWGLLQWARSSDAAMSSFYQIWAKLLPTRAQVDEQDELNDADTDLLDDIRFIYETKRSSVLQTRSKGTDGESGVSGGDDAGDGQAPAA